MLGSVLEMDILVISNFQHVPMIRNLYKKEGHTIPNVLTKMIFMTGI